MTPDQQTVLDILHRNVDEGLQTFQTDVALTDMGIDSLKFIMLVLEIENQLGRTIFNMESIGELRTVDDLLNLVQQ